mgnify:CR=1 FL=1
MQLLLIPQPFPPARSADLVKQPLAEVGAERLRGLGIEPVTVLSRVRGTYRDEQIFLGCAFTSGLEKVVVPFFDKAMSTSKSSSRICSVEQTEKNPIFFNALNSHNVSSTVRFLDNMVPPFFLTG